MLNPMNQVHSASEENETSRGLGQQRRDLPVWSWDEEWYFCGYYSRTNGKKSSFFLHCISSLVSRGGLNLSVSGPDNTCKHASSACMHTMNFVGRKRDRKRGSKKKKREKQKKSGYGQKSTKAFFRNAECKLHPNLKWCDHTAKVHIRGISEKYCNRNF